MGTEPRIPIHPEAELMTVAYATIRTATGRPANTDHLAVTRRRGVADRSDAAQESDVSARHTVEELTPRSIGDARKTSARRPLRAPVCCANQDG